MNQSEENYLKALYLTAQQSEDGTSGTNALAARLAVKPGSVSEMLKRLREKNLVAYEKYGRINLTEEGQRKAVEIVRKHRLWETFLCEKLKFSWDEVHDIAEDLEHIGNEKLTERLEAFLNFPTNDPHGDPIPDKAGRLQPQTHNLLSTIAIGRKAEVVGVRDSSAEFLRYSDSVGIKIGSRVEVLERATYDGQVSAKVDGNKVQVSQKFAENILVLCDSCAAKVNTECCF